MITGRSASLSSSPARSSRPSRRARGCVGQRRILARRLLGRLHEHVVQREVQKRRSAVGGERGLRSARSTRPGISAVAPAVAASFVSGRTNGTWSISCSEPCPQRSAGARPPSTTIGEWLACAEAIALIPLVTPGPAVSAQTPGSRVTFAQPSAANAAVDSWRTSTIVDPLLATAVVDREQVAARQREQLAHTVRLQAPCDQPAAVEGLGLLRALAGHRRRLYPLRVSS